MNNTRENNAKIQGIQNRFPVKPPRSSIERALPSVKKAIMRGDAKTLHEFILHGFPLEEKIGNLTLIQFAVTKAPNFDIIKVLLHCGADAFKTTPDGGNLIHLCCKGQRLDMLERLWPYLARYKLTRYLHSRTRGGRTPLMAAIQSGSARTVALCLNAGMNGQDADYSGITCADIVKQSCEEAKANKMLALLEMYK